MHILSHITKRIYQYVANSEDTFPTNIIRIGQH